MTASKAVYDFTNVKDAANFNPRRKPEGDYRMVIKKVEDHNSKQGNKGWVFTIVPVNDQRSSYPYYVQHGTEQAWKVRNLFVAAGKAIPKKRVNVNPNVIVGREIGVTLVDDEYEGKIKSTIDQVFPPDDLTEDEPEESTTRTRKARKKPVEDLDDSDEDIDELDLEEL